MAAMPGRDRKTNRVEKMPQSNNCYRVQLFARIEEHVGGNSWVYESDAQLTARQLLDAFFDAYPALDGLSKVTRLAVNHVFCREDCPLDPKDELALIPPVSGG
uniref:Molybdopterin synthase sulfur carrier subunit n=2 Tax=Candidatus Kentrum sp. LFY TaxID=2126342 RepID=A0A450V5B8_9GAMM|nr:MAG: molybdopterin synthase sulfur carrier subunit [Candidatus Kentron sp. LFY]